MQSSRLAGCALQLFASVALADASVELQAVGPNRIYVIKVVREVTGLGLKESKELVESKLPKVVKAQLDPAAANEIAAKLRAAGATAAVVSAEGKPTAAPSAAAPAPGRPSAVTLIECGPNKIQMIKLVREATGLGLKDAKDLVEKTPSVVKKGLPPADAEALANKLQFAGGTAKVTADAP